MAHYHDRDGQRRGYDEPEDPVRQLDRERNKNDQKLKARFEHIFRKYHHDFTGVGDEIDIASGEIVVNNGHLQHMRHEADPGKSASSRFLRTFQDKLWHEDETASEDSDDSEEGDDFDESDGEDEEEDDEGEDDEESDQGSVQPSSNLRRTHPNLMTAFGDLARPAPQLARILLDEGTPQRPVDLTGEPDYERSSSEGSASTEAAPSYTNMLAQVPGLQDSVRAMKPMGKRPAPEIDPIQALGVTIANQLAQLMAGPVKTKKGKRHKHRKSRRLAKGPTTDPAWDYPELPDRSHLRKRPRSPSPAVHTATSPSGSLSPGQSSLWAPEGSVRPSKRRRQDPVSPPRVSTPSARQNTALPSSMQSRRDTRRCWNCSLTSSSSWHVGPHGQDLCVSCGRYFELHRRMRNFDSPTPSMDEEDEDDVEAVSSIIRSSRDQFLAGFQPGFKQGRMRQSQRLPERLIKDEPLPVDMAPSTHERQLLGAEQILYEPSELQPVDRSSQATGTPHHEPALMDEAPAAVDHPEVNRNPPLPRMNAAARPIEPTSTHHVPRGDESLHSASSGQGMASLDMESQATVPQPRTTTPFLGYMANTSRPLRNTPFAQQKFQRFTIQEDALMIKLKEIDQLTWEEVGRYFPERSSFAVQARYSKRLRSDDSAARKFLAEHPDEVAAVQRPGEDSSQSQDQPWSEDQDQLLLHLRDNKKFHWTAIGNIITGHTASAAERRYNLLHNGTLQATGQTPAPQAQLAGDEGLRSPSTLQWGNFTADEDAYIVRLREVESLSWDEVGSRFPGRSLGAIQKRYSSKLAPKKRKVIRTAHDDKIRGTMEDRILAVDPTLATTGPAVAWTPAEDQLLKELRDQEHLEWEAIAGRVPGRTASSLQHRYEYMISMSAFPVIAPPTENLPTRSVAASNSQTVTLQSAVAVRPGPGSRNPFTKVEDERILQLRDVEGLSWEQIASHMPGRSVRAISERYSDTLCPAEVSTASRGTKSRPKPGSRPSTNTPNELSEVDLDEEVVETASDSVSRAPISASPNTDTQRRYSSEEDRLIVELHGKGRSWSEIAKSLSGRTADAVALRFSAKLRKTGRKSLPVTLPSTSRKAGNPLLRKALGNSLRRRSDQMKYGIADPTNDDMQVDASDVRVDGPSRQLFREWQPYGKAPSHERENEGAGFIPTDTDTDMVDTIDHELESSLLDEEHVPQKQLETHSVEQSRKVITPVASPRRTRTSGRKRVVESLTAADEPTETEEAEGIVSGDESLSGAEAPEIPFSRLVRIAFEANSSASMQCKDIYQWVESNYEFYRLSPPSWKARVRAELSANPSFVRRSRDDGVIAWQLVEDADDGTPLGLTRGPRRKRGKAKVPAAVKKAHDEFNRQLEGGVEEWADEGLSGDGGGSVEEMVDEELADKGETKKNETAVPRTSSARKRKVRISTARLEIPDSEDDDADDELLLPSSPPSGRRSSSSPSFLTTNSPAAGYGWRARTPRSAMRWKTPSRSTPAPVFASRGTPAPLVLRFNTPVRESDPDEDELA